MARNDLLVEIEYPDSVEDSDVVMYAYNRLGGVGGPAQREGHSAKPYRRTQPREIHMAALRHPPRQHRSHLPTASSTRVASGAAVPR